jgi:hypothetical protein
MSRYRFLILVVILCLVPVSGYAKVYRYIDKEGVERYSNQLPPEGAKIIEETKEVKYDKAADSAQQEINRREGAAAQPPPATPPVSASPPVPAEKGADVSIEPGGDSDVKEKKYSRRKHRRKKEIRKENAEMRKTMEAAEQTK